MKRLLFLIAAIFTISVSQIASAQWVQVGASGHRVDALVTTDSNTIPGRSVGLYAGTHDCFVFFSADTGATLQEVGDSIIYNEGGQAVLSLAVIDTMVFAGTFGNVNRSTDHGKTWTAFGNSLMSNFPVYGLNLIGAGSLRPTLFASSYGLFSSTDSGRTWIPSSTGFSSSTLPAEAVVEMGTEFFAATWNGVYCSRDSGKSWINTGLADTSANCLVVSGSNTSPRELITGTNKGVLISSDTGKNWISMSSGLQLYSPPDNKKYCYISALTMNGTNLFTGANAYGNYSSGVFVSINNGTSWLQMNAGLEDTNVFALAIVGPYLFAGTNNGVWRRSIAEMIGSAGVGTKPTTDYRLSTYPNPFTDKTTITLSPSESGVVELSVVNLLGQEVARVFEGELSAGEHSFTWDASGLPDGMYECVVRMNGRAQELPIVLAR